MAVEKDTELEYSADEEDDELVNGEAGSSVMTTLVTGAAVAILAPELLPGMALGVVAVAAPRVLPALGTVLRPLMRTAVRAGYTAALTTREFVAEASEQVQDAVAEARAEQNNNKPAARTRRPRKTAARRRAHA